MEKVMLPFLFYYSSIMRRKVKVEERGKSRHTSSPEQDFPKLIWSKTLFFEYKHYSDQQNIKIIIIKKVQKNPQCS